MAKIFLLSTSLQESVQLQVEDNSYSLGMAYLHSSIRQAGYDIHTENYNNIPEHIALKSIRGILDEEKPEYLLIQMFTMTRVSSYRVIKLAKKLNPNIKIIVGGVHASVLYRQLVENFPIDYVVIGEGELAIIELLDALENGKPTSDIKGLAYTLIDKGEGLLPVRQTVVTEMRELNKKLDDLPFPAHELFVTQKSKIANIITTRGCPFLCSFCCLHTISKRKFRKRSIESVVDEVEYILDTFAGVEFIQIADDTFALDMKRAKELCREIIRRGIKVKFWCSTRFKPADTELFELMVEAGFTDIGFGLESGSPKMLKNIHKSISQEDVLETFGLLKDLPITPTTFLMVGFPEECDETVQETVNLVKKLKSIKSYNLSGVAPLWVYPDTEVYDKMKEAGKIDDNYWLTDKDVPYYTVDHSYHQLRKMSLSINYHESRFKQIRSYYGYFVKKYLLQAPTKIKNRIALYALENELKNSCR